MSLFSKHEPIVISWEAGKASLGYLGGLRWKVLAGEDTAEADDLTAAIGWAFDTVFRGVEPGSEAEVRTPLYVKGPGSTLKLVRDERFTNGWHFIIGDVEGTLGKHDKLVGFVANHVARFAHKAWERGVKPQIPPPLGKQFSFKAFSSANDPTVLCQQLATELTARIQAHPSPAEAFVGAMQELKSQGHDLWSHTPEEVWGCDYMTRRKGAGLHIQRYTTDDDDDDEVIEAETVSVEFSPRRTRSSVAEEPWASLRWFGTQTSLPFYWVSST